MTKPTTTCDAPAATRTVTTSSAATAPTPAAITAAAARGGARAGESFDTIPCQLQLFAAEGRRRRREESRAKPGPRPSSPQDGALCDANNAAESARCSARGTLPAGKMGRGEDDEDGEFVAVASYSDEEEDGDDLVQRLIVDKAIQRKLDAAKGAPDTKSECCGAVFRQAASTRARSMVLDRFWSALICRSSSRTGEEGAKKGSR